MIHVPRTKWTDEVIEQELRVIIEATGSFPTNTVLCSIGRFDLASAMVKSGGFVKWSEKFGVQRQSDSDFGWAGEEAFAKLCRSVGLETTRVTGVRSPYDLLILDTLRVDVKTASFAQYGKKSGGWFYGIGKYPQADLIVLYQADTGDFFGLPWWVCPTSNVTIRRIDGMYARYLNNWRLIERMIDVRQQERSLVGAVVGEVA